MPRTVGVLGGMGPEATLVFLEHLLRLTPAGSDQEHLPVIVFNDPRIPDRTAFLFGEGPSPLPMLIDLVRKLEAAGAELVAIPCNTAHYFWSELSDSVQVPVLNILDATIDRITQTGPQPPVPGRRIAVMATDGTIRMRLYQDRLERAGYCALLPSVDLQRETQALIRSIKAGAPRSETVPVLRRLVTRWGEAGAEGVILGCTELPLALDPTIPSTLPVFDSLRILAEATLQAAR